jgi:hypothetical protein
MAGLLGESWDDPRTAAVFAGLQGLLGGRNAITGLLGGGAAYTQTMAAAKQAAAIQQMHDLQLQQAKRQAAMQEMQDKFRASIPSPTMQAAQAALQDGGGPTLANAAKMAPVNPEAEFMHGAMQANLIDPVQYIQAQRKDTAPLISKAGDVARDPRTGKVLWQNDDKDKTPEAIRAIEAVYGANSPQAMQAKQAYIQKMTTHQPGVSVSYGAPVAGVDAQGNSVFFQPDKTGGKPAIIPGVAPPAAKLGEGQTKQVAGIDALDSAINEYVDKLSVWKKSDAIRPDKRAEIGTAYNNMMLQAKEAYNLGVLNGPDYQILQSVVRDPTSPMAAIVSNDALARQALDLQRMMKGVKKSIVGAKASAKSTQQNMEHPDSSGWSITPMGGN